MLQSTAPAHMVCTNVGPPTPSWVTTARRMDIRFPLYRRHASGHRERCVIVVNMLALIHLANHAASQSQFAPSRIDAAG